MTLPEWEWEADLLDNLNAYIGVDLRYVLGIPKNVLTGDRALYLLKGGHETELRIMDKLRNDWAMDEVLKVAPTHPHVVNLDSVALEGAPAELQLRVSDLLGDLAYRRAQLDYLYSGHFLPEPDWDVRWLLGAIFLAHHRILAYADYRSGQLGILFTEVFYVESDEPEAQKRQVSRLMERLQGVLTLKNRYGKRDAKWVKIINIAAGGQYVAVMSNKGELTIEEIPYPDL